MVLFDKQDENFVVDFENKEYHLSDKDIEIISQYKNVILNAHSNIDISCFEQGHENGCNCPSWLPNTITHLTLGYFFRGTIRNLPIELQFLQLSRKFNNNVDNLPRRQTFYDKENNTYFETTGLIELRFGHHFNKPVDNLPNSLKILEFGEMFNQPVDNLPNGIKELIFGKNFNQPVDFLPSELEILNFDSYFDNPVHNLPRKLKKIIFDYSFNQSVCSLPRELEELKFGYYFNKQVCCDCNYACNCEFYLPVTLKKLTFGNNFNQSIHRLPFYITVLEFGEKFNQPLFCKGKKKCVCYIPQYVQYLTFGDYFNQPLTCQNNGHFCGFSNHLIYLKLGREFNQSIDCLPNTIKNIESFNNTKFNQALMNLPVKINKIKLPSTFNNNCFDFSRNDTLEEIKFGSSFNQKLSGINSNMFIYSLLPKYILILEFGKDFNENLYYFNNNNELCPILPKTIVNLKFGDNFNQTIFVNCGENYISLLPENLTTLEFGKNFNQSIGYNKEIILPNNITDLSFGNNFNQDIGSVEEMYSYIPKKLEKIKLGYNFNKPICYEENSTWKTFLPDTVRIFNIGSDYSYSIKKLPKSLISTNFNNKKCFIDLEITNSFFQHKINGDRIDIDCKFNRPFSKEDTHFLSNFKIVYFESNFKYTDLKNCKASRFPDSIQELHFSKFNQTICGSDKENCEDYEVIIPNSLKILYLGDDFNQPIDNLPDSIEVLFLGDRFNKEINNIPNKIEKLDLSNRFNKSINLNNKNLKLKELTLSRYFLQSIGCTGRYCTCKYNFYGNVFDCPSKLPDSIEKFDICSNIPICYEVIDGKMPKKTLLPSNLKILKLCNSQNICFKIDDDTITWPSLLPNKIKELYIGQYMKSLCCPCYYENDELHTHEYGNYTGLPYGIEKLRFWPEVMDAHAIPITLPSLLNTGLPLLPCDIEASI